MDSERIEILKKLIQMDPSDTFSRFALALEHKEEKPVEAVQLFEELLKLDPDYVPAYFQAGLTRLDQNDFDQARDWLERGIEVAQKVGDDHALGEMQEVLDTL
jgi:tetratricopeptide (TPR) repeat protein